MNTSTEMNIIKKIILILVFFIIVFQLLIKNAYSIELQDVRPEIMTLVDSMSNEECVRFFRLTNHFIRFRETVLIDELKILIHHKNIVIRAYSFWVLSIKDYNQSFEILIQNIKNNRNYGCYFTEYSWGDTPYAPETISEGYLYYRIWNTYSYTGHKSTEKQRKLVDSLIFHEKTAIPMYEILRNSQSEKSPANNAIKSKKEG